MTSRTELPHAFRQLADLAEIRGATLEALDLRRLADALQGMEPRALGNVTALARQQRLSEMRGVPAPLRGRIAELIEAGPEQTLRLARLGVPSFIRWLLELQSVSTSEACTLVTRLGVVVWTDLEQAIDDGRLEEFLGRDAAQRMRTAAAALASDPPHSTLGRAWDALEGLITRIAEHCPVVTGVEPAGDVRRFEPVVGPLVLVATSHDPETAVDHICALPGLAGILHRSRRRAVVSHQQNEFDIRLALPADRGSAMFRATGPAAHVTAVLNRAGEADFGEEEEIYARAGLVYLPPEVRGTAGALEAAAVGQLPTLIERRHIRGDLHMHSTYSDGRDSMAAMVETCVAIGHEYVAITDHSAGASASRTLAAEEIPRQRDEIAMLRERFPWIAILHGVEVDILPDGRLDFDDRTLEQFDIVLASLHDRAGQDGARLTSRCVAALRHPLVSVLTHPANRLPGRRGGYPLDYGLLFETAALTGTALEVDGAPGHLDMDGELARAAVAGGATVVIDSDCHRARSLEKQLRFGVGTARRGWVEPRHVLNARSIDDVRAFITRKRRQ